LIINVHWDQFVATVDEDYLHSQTEKTRLDSDIKKLGSFSSDDTISIEKFKRYFLILHVYPS